MKRLFAIAVMIAAATSPLAAQAQPGRGEQDQARDGVRAGRQVPLSAVLAQITARTPGRVVMFVVDAESGRIISQQGR